MMASSQAGEGVRELRIWELLNAVPDPEIPVLSIVDLGIVRHVRSDAAGRLTVGLTPTYSGCPATEAIRAATRAALDAHGHADVRLEEVLSPPWTSEWLSARGREKLREFGIAPAAGTRRQPAPPVALHAGDLSALRQPRQRAPERVWFDAMQGALPLHQLPRTLRLFQVYLKC